MLEKKKYKDIFVRLLEKDRDGFLRLLEYLKDDRKKFVGLLISATKWEDVRFLQGILTFINELIELMEGKDGGL